MPGKYKWCKLSECDINDPFFDSLKADYPEFENWFLKKASEGKEAFVYTDEQGIGAFICLKQGECEEIVLEERVLPPLQRMKISTLKLAERVQGIRLGEGAIGIALWKWQEDKSKEIYVTVFEKHSSLISLLEKFGFMIIGKKATTNEYVMLRSRESVDYSDPFRSFPFINPNFKNAGVIPIIHGYHDTLFPFSELKNTQQETDEIAAANGITKIFIGTPSSPTPHEVGEPLVIYRKSDKEPRKYHSAVTSFCVIASIHKVKENFHYRINENEYLNIVGNKSVYTKEELQEIYRRKGPNLVLYELVYNGAFGGGHNICYDELCKNNLGFDVYPYMVRYTKDQFSAILQMGDKDVQNIIID